jgi:hypothetical protein
MVCGASPARFGWSGAGDDREDWILSGARVYRVCTGKAMEVRRGLEVRVGRGARDGATSTR